MAPTYLNDVGRKVSPFKNNLPSIAWANKRHKNALLKQTCCNIKSSRACVSSKIVLNYFDNLKHHVKGVLSGNIFNFGETNLTDNPGMRSCIFKCGPKYLEQDKCNFKACILIMLSGLTCEKIFHVMRYIKLNIFSRPG